MDTTEYRQVAEAATQGEWRDQNPDDYASMNIFCVTINGTEPEDDSDMERDVICATLLQSPGRVGMTWEQVKEVGGDWEANARHIATFSPPTVLALLDEVDRLRRLQGLSIADYERLLAWMRDPQRVNPSLHFTAGAARDAAYAFAEYLQETTDA